MAAHSSLPVAIVCGEGGVRGGYIAGVLTALEEAQIIPLHQVHTWTGVSAGACAILHAASYNGVPLARRMWTETLACPKFIHETALHSVRECSPSLDIAYMVSLFKEHELYRPTHIDQGPSKLYIPLLNVQTNQIEVWDKQDILSHDPHTVTLAATSAPVLVDTPVKLNGATYVDPGERLSFIMPPEESEFRTLVILPCGPFSKAEARLYMSAGNTVAQQAKNNKRILPGTVYDDISKKPSQHNAAIDQLRHQQANGQLMLICPDTRGTFDYADLKTSLTACFNAGVDYVHHHADELKDFLK